jgi:integrase
VSDVVRTLTGYDSGSLPMKINLTDRFVAGAKADATVRSDFFDSTARGLSLRVSGTGVKSWCYHLTRNGKRERITLGSYPAIGLADARRLAVEARAALEGGEDPRDLVTARQRGAMTVSDLFDIYLTEHVQTNRRSPGEVERRLRKNILPVIGAVPLANIHRRDITRTVQPVLKRGAPLEATLVFADLRTMLRWGVRTGYLDHDPTIGMQKPASAKTGERVLSDEEIATLWNRLPQALPRSVTQQRILRLCLITGQRVGEIAGMRRTELNLETRAWSLPGSRTKNKHPHLVPLSDLAVRIIREAIADAGESPFVFPVGDTTASTNQVAHAAARGDFGIADWSPHDLRRTALTRMAEMGTPPIVLGYVANHRTTTHAGVTLAVYSKYNYESEKRQALEAWAARLLAIVGGGGANG